MIKNWLFLISLLIGNQIIAQTHVIENVEAIRPFYTQLDALQNNQTNKVRITHIGDSHIQADFFSGRLRANFQNIYGKGGLGFSFPYKLAHTNGNRAIKYTTNTNFKVTRNIFANSKQPVGLSGYAFQSKNPNTAIKMLMQNDSLCHTITVLCNNPTDLYFATYNANKDFSKLIPKASSKIHRVKSGESLWGIAIKYKVSVKKIQKLNRLRGNLIHPNQKLKIPTKEVVRVKVKPTDFNKLQTTIGEDYITYHSDNTIDEIYLFSENNSKNMGLYGLILENNYTGVILNTIGVNGAKCDDFNKFPVFFKQLSYLQSDLIILSLGTNESFDHLDEALFIDRFLNFIKNIRKDNAKASILVTTPPASLFKRRKKNTYIIHYIEEIKTHMYDYNYAVWDLYNAFGGHEKINQNYKNGLMAKDRIHYTKEGYYQQADLFFDDLMNFKN